MLDETAQGMAHLTKYFVHRDLAARNVMQGARMLSRVQSRLSVVVVCCLPSHLQSQLSAVYRPSTVVRRPLSVVRRPSSIFRRPSSVVSRLLSVFCRLSSIH